MKEENSQMNEGVQPQEVDSHLNMKTQFYADDMKQSKVFSVVSQSNNPQNLLKYFQQYDPFSKNIDMSKLHASQHLKLKKYKQSVYYGQFINNKRHGKGIMFYHNGRVYQGDWQCDYKYGKGFEKFPNECTYQGEYINGRPEGVGRYSWPNGQFYEGEWINGLKQGSGMWRGAKGDSYVGQWKFGKADGYGVHTWVNGDRYQGEFKQCLKHGQGIQKFANGDIYKGKYANGKPSGFGQYYWSNGSYFKGMFKNGLRDGHGMWKKGPGNNDKYEGQYINDKKSGYGIFTWQTGNIYKGNYDADVRNGYGQMYWNDGSYYKGNWNNGIQHGQGEIYVPGEGYKKGVFQNNMLIIVQSQSHVAKEHLQNNLPIQNNHQTIQDPEKLTIKSSYRSKNDNPLAPSKVSFRSRGYSSKNRIRDQNVIRHGATATIPDQYNKDIYSQNHPYISNKNSRRQQKYMTVQRRSLKPRPETKQRILHSSFYMHKLHNRTNTSVNGSKADTQIRRDSNQIQNQIEKNALQQMRYFTRSRGTNRNSKAPYV